MRQGDLPGGDALPSVGVSLAPSRLGRCPRSESQQVFLGDVFWGDFMTRWAQKPVVSRVITLFIGGRNDFSYPFRRHFIGVITPFITAFGGISTAFPDLGFFCIFSPRLKIKITQR